MLNCMLSNLGITTSTKPCHKLDKLELNLPMGEYDVVRHAKAMTSMNTKLEVHQPTREQCEILAEPIINILVRKSGAAQDTWFQSCAEAVNKFLPGNNLRAMQEFHAKAMGYQQKVTSSKQMTRVLCENMFERPTYASVNYSHEERWRSSTLSNQCNVRQIRTTSRRKSRGSA